jgi:hypothetical protein
MKDMHALLAAGVAFVAGCATVAQAPSSQVYGTGDYRFTARDVRKSDAICLFEGVATYPGREEEPGKLVAIGERCEVLREVANPIHVEADVDLTVEDYREILAMIRAATGHCEETSGGTPLLCLKDEMPRFVTRDGDGYVFWYGRAVNPGDGGIGMVVIRRNGRFEFARTRKE